MILFSGEKLKMFRLLRGINQKELVDGICTQGLLSKIENEKVVPDIDIIYKICIKLGITVERLFNYDYPKIQSNSIWKYKVQHFFNKRDYLELYNLLNNEIISETLITDVDLQLYYYHLGICELYLRKNLDRSISYFDLALSFTCSRKSNYKSEQEILILNSKAVALFLKKKHTISLDYFNSCYNSIKKIMNTSSTSYELTRVFYDAAKAYSELNEYKTAIHYAQEGIEWAQKKFTTYRLIELYYEKGFNEKKTGDIESAKKDYFFSIMLSKIENNKQLESVISNEMNR